MKAFSLSWLEDFLVVGFLRSHQNILINWSRAPTCQSLLCSPAPFDERFTDALPDSSLFNFSLG